MAHAAQTQRDRNLTRHHADNRDGNRVRRHFPPVLGEEIGVLPLADIDSPSAAADDYTGARFADSQAGVLQASRAAMTPMSAAREYRLGSAR